MKKEFLTRFSTYMPTDRGELQRSWIQLRNERDTYREQFHDQERKVLKLTRQLEEERVLNDYISTKRKRPWDFWFVFSSFGFVLFTYL